MGYQALLFCPDDKTSRAVTQVLSELDFAVVPCTEPFAAVKKLMAEHFDAVVVDCDNEQNATLLFKSARNSSNNQNSLAVAVVEGQAGVAKAFRIGANLVLTKPINVEQAKGTLRVARGLLRKNEAGKTPAAPKAATPQTAKSTPAPKPPQPTAKPASTPANVSVKSTAIPSTPAVPPAITATPSATQARTVSAKFEQPKPAVDSDEIEVLEIADDDDSVLTAIDESSPESAHATPAESAPHIQPAPSRGIATGGAASAPAPAPIKEAPVKDTKSIIPAIEKSKTEPAVKQSQPEPVAAAEKHEPQPAVAETSSASEPEYAGSTPSFTFGGTVGLEQEATSGSSKKMLFAVAAVVLVAVGGYAAWMQFGHSSPSSTTPVQVNPQPAKAATPQPATSPAVAIAPAAQPAPVSAPATPPVTKATTSSNSSTHSARSGETSDNTDTPDAEFSEKKIAPAKAAPKPITVKSGSSAGTARMSSTSDAAPPEIKGITAGGAAPMPSLMATSKTPAPVLQSVNVSQGVSQGLLVRRVSPVYPQSALNMRVEGSVQLLATVSKVGSISAVKVVSGDPQLARAAADAVKQWKYKPYTLNGSPVEIQTPITVNFKLPN